MNNQNPKFSLNIAYLHAKLPQVFHCLMPNCIQKCPMHMLLHSILTFKPRPLDYDDEIDEIVVLNVS